MTLLKSLIKCDNNFAKEQVPCEVEYCACGVRCLILFEPAHVVVQRQVKVYLIQMSVNITSLGHFERQLRPFDLTDYSQTTSLP